MVSSESDEPVLAASTATVVARQRFDYFCDALCDVYLGIRPRQITSGAFDADVLAYGWDEMVLSRIRAPGHDATRDRRTIAAKPDDSLFLNVSSDSSSTVAVDGRTIGVRTGTPVLLDNSRAFHLRFDPSRRFNLYSLRLPREIDGERLEPATISAINERMRDTRAGRQLALQAHLMTIEFDAGRTAVAGAMARAVVGLLAVLAMPSAANGGADRLDSYRATAAAHLAEADFGVQEIALTHRVSVRTVQAAFAASGETFSSWILGERLDLARERLGATGWQHRSVEQIARSCGIRDPSNFHKAFKRRFGASPGEFRPTAPR